MLRGRATKSSASGVDDALAVSKRTTRAGALTTRISNTSVGAPTAKLDAVAQKVPVRRGTLLDHKNVVAADKNTKLQKKVLITKQDAKKLREAESLVETKGNQQESTRGETLTGSRFDDVTLHCSDYADDIYDYMFFAENKYGVEAGFLADHAVTPKMRSILVDWLLQVHLRFHLLPETLFATLNILDRYLAVGNADKTNLQLVGITCMSIASKYEEIYAPELQDYVYITENAYTKRDIIRMEITVLSKIGVDLGRPHVIQFLRRLSCYFDAVLHAMAKYICENAVCDYATCHLKPSFIAAVSLWLASRLEDRDFPEDLYKMARASAEDIQEWASVFATGLLKAHNNTKLSALRNKYLTAKNSRVSDLLPNQISILQKMAQSSR
uniref:Cyclin N-terminal domain-containing protein n=1 Tax=Ascaris lumbricoides TaxID=6252 RepID=A0A0M3I267_ASCLU